MRKEHAMTEPLSEAELAALRLLDLFGRAVLAVPEDDGLDVERLARAIERVVSPAVSGVWIDYSGPAKAKLGGIPAARKKLARRIAREYAALAKDGEA